MTFSAEEVRLQILDEQDNDCYVRTVEMLRDYAAMLEVDGERIEPHRVSVRRSTRPYGSVAFGDTRVFIDIAAARVMLDGEIVRTVNGSPITPGTELFVLPAIDSPDSKPYADRNEPGQSDDPT